jgi:hypothetical protein
MAFLACVRTAVSYILLTVHVTASANPNGNAKRKRTQTNAAHTDDCSPRIAIGTCYIDVQLHMSTALRLRACLHTYGIESKVYLKRGIQPRRPLSIQKAQTLQTRARSPNQGRTTQARTPNLPRHCPLILYRAASCMEKGSIEPRGTEDGHDIWQLLPLPFLATAHVRLSSFLSSTGAREVWFV